MAEGLESRDLKPTAEAEGLFRRWVGHLNEEFTRHPAPERRAEVVRDELHQIYLGRPHGGKRNTTLISEMAGCVLAESFDPRNVTLEAEYDDGLDWTLWAPRKPLIWFWRMFDRSPLGESVWLGTRVRCMLGHHIFQRIGKGVKIYSGVEFRYGYNVTIEDGCTLGRDAVLEDRGGLVVCAGTKVAAGAKVSSGS